jgi:uncharacterized protein YjhX (UPF0386 family)
MKARIIETGEIVECIRINKGRATYIDECGRDRWLLHHRIEPVFSKEDKKKYRIISRKRSGYPYYIIQEGLFGFVWWNYYTYCDNESLLAAKWGLASIILNKEQELVNDMLAKVHGTRVEEL